MQFDEAEIKKSGNQPDFSVPMVGVEPTRS